MEMRSVKFKLFCCSVFTSDSRAKDMEYTPSSYTQAIYTDISVQ